MPKRYFFILFLLIVTQIKVFCLTGMIGDFFSISGGTWLKEVTVNSAKDMNWQEDLEHPQDSGGNPATLAIVFCSDEKLKEVLSKITGPDFIKNFKDLKNKYGTSIYVVKTEILPSETKIISVEPKNDDTMGQKIYNNTKFIVGYVSYQTPGDHWLDIPGDNHNVTLVFDKKEVSIQESPTVK